MATNHQPSAPLENWPELEWTEPEPDDIVEEIHAHRRAVSKRFNGNLEEIIRYYASFETGLRLSTDKPAVRRIPAK